MSGRLKVITYLLDPRINSGITSEAELFDRLKALQYPAGAIVALCLWGLSLQNPSPLTEKVVLSFVAVSTAVFTSALIGISRCRPESLNKETKLTTKDVSFNPFLVDPPVDMPQGKDYILALQGQKKLELVSGEAQSTRNMEEFEYSSVTKARLEAAQDIMSHFSDRATREKPRSDKERILDMKRLGEVLSRYTKQGLFLTRGEKILFLEILTRSPMIELAPGVLEEMMKTCAETIREYVNTKSTAEINQEIQDTALSNAIRAERNGHGRVDIPLMQMSNRVIVEKSDAVAIAKTIVDIASRNIPSVRGVTEINKLLKTFSSLQQASDSVQKKKYDRFKELKRYLLLALEIDARETTSLTRDHASIHQDRVVVNIEGCSCYSDIYRRIKAGVIRFPHINKIVASGLVEFVLKPDDIYDDLFITDYGSDSRPLYPSWVTEIAKRNNMESRYKVETGVQTSLPQLSLA